MKVIANKDNKDQCYDRIAEELVRDLAKVPHF